MTKVTIIGATGSLGRAAQKALLEQTDAELVLYARSADRLEDQARTTRLAADVSDTATLENAVAGADLVFVALSGNLPKLLSQVMTAMDKVGSKRIVFISSYGIYGELPGQNGRVDPILKPYRKAADLLEASDLDYTILRPGWFDNNSDQSYQLFPKGEIITGNTIARSAIASLVTKMVQNPSQYLKENLGIVRN
ncbi:NAD(P)H-binding protein [Streptococcus loxodontisalivarius]|uniref:Uncharacterized protein YbjT (DUF2867 family) n=1 Tax=Streptococcus loxodontisalivarius TaxID=1349415 RepID=A0ABS2PQE3_9STRE|nr:NAD(P)H-binding protein [Streptococcus loxodontisalivarius]MBM7642271.1 uncharacterized protein YbjT (DUF2867 family) [Streptococcus loxodontisalivarius]